MMVSISTAPQPWQPAWVTEGAPTFMWRAPTVTERELFEGEMARHNALTVYPWDIGAAFRSGLATLLEGNADEAAALDELRERQVNGEPLDAAETAMLAEAVSALMQYWPAYRLLVEQAARREVLMPLIAFRRFVTGWEGKVGAAADLTLVRGIDGLITEAVMADVDASYMRALGATIYNSMYARGAEKNSEPPSGSDDDPATSTTMATDGKSAKTSGN